MDLDIFHLAPNVYFISLLKVYDIIYMEVCFCGSSKMSNVLTEHFSLRLKCLTLFPRSNRFAEKYVSVNSQFDFQ